MCICCCNISACTVQNCGKCTAEVGKCEACIDGYFRTSDTTCTGKYRPIINMTDILRIIFFDTPSFVIFSSVCLNLSLSFFLSPSLSLPPPLSLSSSLPLPLLSFSFLHCDAVSLSSSIPVSLHASYFTVSCSRFVNNV